MGVIYQERRRQIEDEGWTAQHDDQNYDGNHELQLAAACYLLPGTDIDLVRRLWPWDWKWWKPGQMQRSYEKAGALVAAKIDQLIRKAVRDD